MSPEEVELRERKSGVGVKLIEKYNKNSTLNKDKVDGYQKLMKKVDRRLEKEIIDHFDLLNSDSEHAAQRPL